MTFIDYSAKFTLLFVIQTCNDLLDQLKGSVYTVQPEHLETFYMTMFPLIKMFFFVDPKTFKILLNFLKDFFEYEGRFMPTELMFKRLEFRVNQIVSGQIARYKEKAVDLDDIFSWEDMYTLSNIQMNIMCVSEIITEDYFERTFYKDWVQEYESQFEYEQPQNKIANEQLWAVKSIHQKSDRKSFDKPKRTDRIPRNRKIVKTKKNALLQ